MRVIGGEKALRTFREHLTGKRILSLLRKHNGRLLVELPLGVGKSRNIDHTIEAAVRGGQYDLIVVLLPTRQVLDERRWIQHPPRDVRIENLQPRPRQRCGPEFDAAWRTFEKAHLGALGRQVLCRQCPHRMGCFWPKQYGKRLLGVQVIFATQAHLERSPTFLTQLLQWTEATHVLVLLDEVNFLMTTFHRRIPHGDLIHFVEVLKGLTPFADGPTHRDWVYRADLLLRAQTEDLRHPDWGMPRVFPKWALAVQECGWETYGEEFKFLAYDLQQFGHSPLESRERTANGDLLFAAPPYIDCDFVIYSGTVHPEFSQFRLGQDFASPFSHYRFTHPKTVWYNIASRLGMKKYFRRNAPQILDFFAGLVARRLREGRLPLLIAKQDFLSFCAQEIEHRLHEEGITDARVVWDAWDMVDLSAPHVVPLLHYGMVGTNLFERFDCAYCLTGYYVNERIVNTTLQDFLASDGHIPITIKTQGYPLRRIAGVRHARDRLYDVHHLAQLALNQQEMDVVLQAVGRVRPYTKPREVVTFQCAAHPQLAYTEEFHSLGDARRFFAIPHQRAQRQSQNVIRIQAAKQEGLTQVETTSALGVSLRTVKRYWREGKSATSRPLNN